MAPGEIDSLGLPVLGPNFWALFVLFFLQGIWYKIEAQNLN